MRRFLSFCLILLAGRLAAQTTYCNPLNIDYGHTPIPGAAAWGAHRATADPVIVRFKGDYYLFSTNQRGYWWSANLSDWHFVSRSFLRPDHDTYDDLCAPAVGIIGDTMLVFGSTYTRDFPIWMSTEPKKADSWTEAVHKFDIGGWDPAFFTDTDGRLYLYNGSSNRYPIYGVELDGQRHDIGNKLDFLKTNLIYGLERPELADPLREFIKRLSA